MSILLTVNHISTPMKHPFQILITNKKGTHIFAIVKNYLQVFDISKGGGDDDIKVGEWQDTTESNHPKIQIEKRTGRQISTQQIHNHLRYLILTPDEQHIIASTDSDKSILIFKIDFNNSINCLKLIKRQPIPKRPSSITIDSQGQRAIVADKFGDVYTVSINDDSSMSEIEIEIEKDIQPILGHVSMLTDITMATTHHNNNNKQFIITADRDEHIRISNYPKSYVIKNFLFGHDEFVSQLYIPVQYDPSILISGGGDDFINIWKWYEGELIETIQLRQYIESYLSDDHLPPTRFRTETSPKEISIAKIATLRTNDDEEEEDHLLIVLVENTPVLLVFNLDDSYKAKYLQTIIVNDSIIDFAIAADNKTIITSLESEQHSIKYFTLQEENGGKKFSEIQGPNIEQFIPIEVEQKLDFQQLYTIFQLRKRSDS